MKIGKDSKIIKQIPINIFYPEGAKHLPLIFFVHGYFNNKDEGSTLAKSLASKGFVVVTIDAYMHGDRLEKRLLEINEEDYLYEMYKIVERTGNDIDILIHHLKKDKRIDIQKIGMTGISMGAFTTFYTITRTSKINVAATVIGLPAFYNYWCDYVENYEDNQVKKLLQEKDTSSYREYLVSIDPKQHMDEFKPIPLLMINGLKDENVPYLYVQDYYHLLGKKYKNKEELKLSLYDVGHCWNADMFREVVSWFVTYLK